MQFWTWDRVKQIYLGHHWELDPFCLFSGATAPAGQGLIVEASWSHSDTPHLVGLLWTSAQPDTETSTWEHTALTRDRHLMSRAGFEPTIAASERLQTHALRRRGHWDRPDTCSYGLFLKTAATITSERTDIPSWITLYLTSLLKNRLQLTTFCNAVITEPEVLILFSYCDL
jgi:hypothetical protein